MQHTEAPQAPEYVYELPVRLWHWVNAGAVAVLAITGYLIANPPYSLPGEASAHYLLGTIRFLHFASGYVLAVGLAGRLYWAIAGNHHAREMLILPFWRRQWLSDLYHEVRWYTFLDRRPRRFVGHNPLGQIAAFVLTALSVFMMITGFALYSEGAGAGHWTDAALGWVLPALGGSQAVHTWHHMGLWLFVALVIGHVYTAIREDIMSRQTLLSTMVSGWRYFRK